MSNQRPGPAPSAIDVLIVGGGRMGEALLGGLLDSGVAIDDVAVAEVSEPRRRELASRYPGLTVAADAVPAEAVVVATKPAQAADAVRSAVAAGARRVLSIAAGVSTATLEAAAGDGVPVIRTMSNTPALVGAGASAVTPGRFATEADLVWAESILSRVGVVVRVPEDQIDAVTGLSGSGPAYVFLLAEALDEAGVLVGLPRPVAQALVRQTLLGAARLLDETGESPHDLRVAVTSPGGTTAAGLHVLEERAVRAAVLDAVAAATRRARELDT